MKLFHLFDFNLLEVAHYERGIAKYFEVSGKGEEFFLRHLLPKIISSEKIVVFDVGANTGEYSLLLKKVFPKSAVYAFEPNPKSFHFLQQKAEVTSGLYVQPLGVGDKESQLTIFTEKENQESQLASFVPGVMTELHQNSSEQLIGFDIQVVTLNDFCAMHGITHIHFLKIDTEGYELNVLKGATRLVSEKKIDVIQFEFNEMNVYARVFLNDFYKVLPGYNLFRMDEDRLLYLGPYNPILEIFRYQNFIAIRHELTPNIFTATLLDKAGLYNQKKDV